MEEKAYRRFLDECEHLARPFGTGNFGQKAEAFARFFGTPTFLIGQSAVVAVWIAVNVGMLGAALKFDEFPFGLLTMVVSLEAIFLATFVMVSQNRQAARSDIRSDLDFENNLRSEIWSVHIGQALGLDAEHVEAVVRAAIDGYRSETLGTTNNR